MGLLDPIDCHSDGLVPLSVKFIFTRLTSMKQCSVSVSMVQVYKDEAYDLLSSRKGAVQIREDPETKVFFIPGLVIVPLEAEQQAVDLLNAGLQQRTMAPQQLNPTSSRSHLVLTFYLMKQVSPGTEVVRSKLTFADLAGNERVSKSESRGLRLEEARHINSSLSSLAEAICHLKTHNDVQLFRKNKLTKILQLSLMGQAYICVLGMVRKSPLYISETLSTLQFVLRCSQIKMADPAHCSLQDIHAELHQKESHSPDHQNRKSPSDEEFSEFAQFLGKCLVSLSRMIRKLLVEVPQRIAAESEDSDTDDPPVISDEVLLDLEDASSIPDVLTVVQSSFKVIVEQLRRANERVSQLCLSQADHESRVKSEQPIRFNQQVHHFTRDFQKVFSKMINQLLITKFEGMASMPEAKQVLPILQHFTDHTLADLIREIEEVMSVLVGQTPAHTFVSQIELQLKSLFSSLGGTPGSLTFAKIRIDMARKDYSCQTETNTEGVSRGVQVDQSFKSISTQADDNVLNKKVELLMAANKKLKTDCDYFLQEKASKITVLTAANEELSKELALLKCRPREESRDNHIFREQLQLLQAELDASRREATSFEKDNRALKDNLAGLVKDFNQQKETLIKMRAGERAAEQAQQELDQGRQLSKQLSDRLRQVQVDADLQLSHLTHQLEILTSEIRNEKQACQQFKTENACLKQQVADADSQVEILMNEKKLREDNLEDRQQSNAFKVAEAYSSRDERVQENADLKCEVEELKANLAAESLRVGDLETRLEDERGKVEDVKKRVVEKCNQKLQEVASEASRQMERLNSKLYELQQKVKEREIEIEEKDKVVRELTATYNVSLDKKVQLEAELDSARNSLPSARQDLELVKGLQNRLLDLEQKLIDTERLLSETHQRLEESDKRLAEKIQLLIASDARVRDLSGELLTQQDSHQDTVEKCEIKFSQAIAQLEEDLASHKVALSMTKERLNEVLESHKKVKDSFEHRIATLQDESCSDESQLRFALAKREQELNEAYSRLTEQQTQLEETRDINRQSAILFEEHRTKFIETDKVIRVLTAENASLVEGLKSQTDHLKQQSAKVHDLQTQLIENATLLQLPREKNARMDHEALNIQIYSEEIASLKAKLSTAETALTDKDSALLLAQTTAIQRNSLLERVHMEHQSLEKEVLELRPIKNELIQTSVHIQKLKAEVEAQRSKLVDIDQLRQKLSTSEKACELEQQSRETLVQDLKTQHDKMIALLKETLETQIRAKDEQLNRVVSEHANKDDREEGVLSNKDKRIGHLEALVRQKEDELSSSTARLQQELTAVTRRFESDLLEAHGVTKAEIKSLVEAKNYLQQEIKTKEEIIYKLRVTNESLSIAHKEMEDRLEHSRENNIHLEGVVSQLMAANTQFSTKLKEQATINAQLSTKLKEESTVARNLQKKLQAIVSKNGSQSKTDTAYPPQPNSNRGPSPSDKPVATNLISNFDKHLNLGVPSLTLTANSFAEKDKENTDRNLPNSNRYAASHHTKRTKPEEFEKVSDRAPFETREPKSQGEQGLLDVPSGLAGLHTVEENDTDQLRDELRMYSSRYSKASRGSRNSKRSPSPNKYASEQLILPLGPLEPKESKQGQQ